MGVVLADFTDATGDAAFDRTLQRALEIDLEQSPFVDVLSETDSAQTLEKMGRAKDIALTAEIAREICIRNNRQVFLTGCISRVDEEYLATLEATICSTGKRVASAKAETANKAKVLGELDSLAERTICQFQMVSTGGAVPTITGTPSISTTANFNSPAGTYPVTPSVGTLVTPSGYSSQPVKDGEGVFTQSAENGPSNAVDVCLTASIELEGHRLD